MIKNEATEAEEAQLPTGRVPGGLGCLEPWKLAAVALGVVAV